MQQKEAEALRESWGDKPCDHHKIVKEYDLGADTGDYVCSTCGKDFSRSEKEQIESDRKKNIGD